MAKTKEQKQVIIDRLSDAFKNSLSTVFVHFKGLSVSEETDMRRALAEDGVTYYVARKTLMHRAGEAAGVEGEAPALEGEIAVAYGSDDQTAPARGVYSFVKKYAEKLSIVGGIFEGRFMNAAEMNEVATIPPMQTLRGMFANVINSPIQGLVVALNAVAEAKPKDI